MPLRRTCLAFGLIAGLAAPAAAQDLIYRPMSPSLGGDPFLGSHLLELARIQRQHFPPRPPAQTRTDRFFSRLETSVLSEASRRITRRLFGEGEEDSGVFTIGVTTVSYQALEDGSVQVVLTDGGTETTTEIVIPSPAF